MLKNLTDDQLRVIADMVNVTATSGMAAALMPQVQLQLLRFEVADELERRSGKNP